MNYIAHVKEGSKLDVLWKQKGLEFGIIENVVFRINFAGEVYWSEKLEPDQIKKLLLREDVEVAAITILPK